MGSKIQIKVGIVEFLGEGDEKWLAAQLEKILSKVPELLKIEVEAPITQATNIDSAKPKDVKRVQAKSTTLSVFLKEKSATVNQNRKFLAAAAFLTTGGNKLLKTSDVTGALKNSQQTKLGNPSQCLNNNVSKGFCEKDGDQFYVTEQGLEEIK